MPPTVRVKHSEIKASSNDSENFRIHSLHPSNEIGRTSQSQRQSQSEHTTIGVLGVSEPLLRNASRNLSQNCTECCSNHVQSNATIANSSSQRTAELGWSEISHVEEIEPKWAGYSDPASQRPRSLTDITLLTYPLGTEFESRPPLLFCLLPHFVPSITTRAQIIPTTWECCQSTRLDIFALQKNKKK